jgi:predicted SAM-dependent methyltransferase
MRSAWSRLRYIATSGLRRRLRDFALRDTRPGALAGSERLLRREVLVLREDLARRYLEGSGIEIGPLAHPLRLPPGVSVRYVDHLPREELVRLNAEMLAGARVQIDAIPRVDVVDDGATLASFEDACVDFVVANHVLEHFEDPIGALRNMLRVIRPGGILLLALPDARHTHDAARPRTSVEHLLRDHHEGPRSSRREHYEEWARIVESTPEAQVAQRVAEFEREDARHHFHVWELEGFLALLHALELPCALELAHRNGPEFDVVLRRSTRA